MNDEEKDVEISEEELQKFEDEINPQNQGEDSVDKKFKIILAAAIGVILVLIVVLLILLLGGKKDDDDVNTQVELELSESVSEEISELSEEKSEVVSEIISEEESEIPEDESESALQAGSENAPINTSQDLPTSESPADDNAVTNGDLTMEFAAADDSVTAKDATNLRDIPSQGSESTVLYTLKAGEVAHRTGISSKGWSRVEYNGNIYYAVTNYLTTDLNVQAPAPDNGIKTVFTACDDQVSPKIEVNLRTLPSVTNENSSVAVKLPYGEVVHRTGYNTEYGWSRVEYNGQTLYCVTSYIYVVEPVEGE